VLALVVVVSGCGSSPPAPTTAAPSAALAADPHAITVPAGTAPTIDGRIDDAEWATASRIALGANELRIVHDRAMVYLAISRPTSAGMAFGCVFVAEPDRVVIHHASAQLGSAIYSLADGAYVPASKTYVWRDAATMLRDEGWQASTVGADTVHQEFALTFERLGLPASSPRRIALGYVVIPPDAADMSTASTVTWPAGLTDGVADAQVLGGFNPDGIRFAPSSWAAIDLAP
jgi:hypothetical protein